MSQGKWNRFPPVLRLQPTSHLVMQSIRSCHCHIALVLHDQNPDSSHFNLLWPVLSCCSTPPPLNVDIAKTPCIEKIKVAIQDSLNNLPNSKLTPPNNQLILQNIQLIPPNSQLILQNIQLIPPNSQPILQNIQLIPPNCQIILQNMQLIPPNSQIT